MPKETFRWNLKFKEFLPIHPFLSTCCHCPANRHHPHPCDRATRERESTRSRTLQRTPSAPAPSKGKERFQEQDPAPNVPTKLIGKALQTPGGDRLCRAYSLGKVCPDAKPGEKCPRGLHLCSGRPGVAHSRSNFSKQK